MPPKVLSPSEVTSLLDAPDLRSRWGRRDRALLAVMALGGLRIAEACSLRREHLDTSGSVTRLTFPGKGGKVRTVTLPHVAADAVARILPDFPAPFLFYSGDSRHFEQRPLSTRGARWVAERYFRDAGLGEWVHCHSLRHSNATILLRALNGDMRTVQRHLGHASPATTAKHYDGWDSTDSDRAAAKMNEVFA